MKSKIASLVLALSCVGSCVTAPRCLASEGPQAAIQRLTAEIRSNPSDMEARKSIAAAFLKTGLAVRAEEQMKIVMQFGKRSSEDLVMLADAQRYTGKYSDAMRSYQEVLGQNHANGKALAGLAYCYMLSGDTTTAARLCQSGLREVSDAAGKKELADALRVVEQSRTQSEQDKALSSATRRG